MRFLLWFTFMLASISVFAQNYGDPEYYLIDSFPLNELDSTDAEVISTRLKEYHEAKSDTAKARAIHWICEELLHEDWVKYLEFQVNQVDSQQQTHI